MSHCQSKVLSLFLRVEINMIYIIPHIKDRICKFAKFKMLRNVHDVKKSTESCHVPNFIAIFAISF